MNRRRFLKKTTMTVGAVTSARLIESGRAQGADRAGPAVRTAGAVNAGAGLLDISNATVVAPRGMSKRVRKAVQVLAEEIERRTAIRLPITETWPARAAASILVSPQEALSAFGPIGATVSSIARPPGPEGYAVRSLNQKDLTVAVIGADERGVLFGVGGLLRNLRMSQNQIRLSRHLNLITHPRYPLRGHQLGYRPKTNSYDAWTVGMWDSYIRDLAIFGTNAIELIPPRSDDEPNSPHFWLAPKQMMIEMARISDEYGLDVWIWYPAMDQNYAEPKTVESALTEWGKIFQALPRIDAVFVPGGDPGHTAPRLLFALLEKQQRNLRNYHPRATIWVSPQGFNREWMDEFFEILDHDRPEWLGGVVFGPQIYLDIDQFRKRIPTRYPIRFYPDITHSLECQFPVAEWDTAYAYTEGREVINPRPESCADIMRLYLPHTTGFISYSEGSNDDVNKFVASALAWDPHASVIGVLREYSRYFVGDQFTDGFAQGLLALERNWRSPLISNDGVRITLRQFQSIEDAASPHDLLSWRLQQGLYRAYYDAYEQARLIYETSLERQAIERLEAVRRFGATPIPLDVGDSERFSPNQLDVMAILSEAESLLARVYREPVSQPWRTRILELGEALYQSIRMQMAVERYQAEAVSRGATLDTLDAPITDIPWLLRRIREIRVLASDHDRIAAIFELLNRTNPGPGGFYDDLGNTAHESRLVRGQGHIKDPEFRGSALDGFDYPDEMGNSVPIAWKNWAESLYDAPLEMYYPNLDREAQYRIRVVYAGDSMEKKIRLVAGRGIEVHGYIEKPWPIKPLEFDISQQATAGGDLRLNWFREPGLGGNGRGCQVAEVWLMIRRSEGS